MDIAELIKKANIPAIQEAVRATPALKNDTNLLKLAIETKDAHLVKALLQMGFARPLSYDALIAQNGLSIE